MLDLQGHHTKLRSRCIAGFLAVSGIRQFLVWACIYGDQWSSWCINSFWFLTTVIQGVSTSKNHHSLRLISPQIHGHSYTVSLAQVRSDGQCLASHQTRISFAKIVGLIEWTASNVRWHTCSGFLKILPVYTRFSWRQSQGSSRAVKKAWRHAILARLPNRCHQHRDDNAILSEFM